MAGLVPNRPKVTFQVVTCGTVGSLLICLFCVPCSDFDEAEININKCKKTGHTEWYSAFNARISKVERDYGV
jgi:hypothetical protein